MGDLVDFVALSLLPPFYGVPAAARLRGGDPPGVVLEELPSTPYGIGPIERRHSGRTSRGARCARRRTRR
jgi:hypothetical protein